MAHVEQLRQLALRGENGEELDMRMRMRSVSRREKTRVFVEYENVSRGDRRRRLRRRETMGVHVNDIHRVSNCSCYSASDDER